MKRYIYAAAVAVVATLALASSASADVPRYQPTATLTVALQGDNLGKVHTFTIAWTNPCGTNGAFTGTGSGNATAGGATESITGTLVGDNLTFTAIYNTYIPGYTWNESMFPITWDVAAITTYKNHGEYVNYAKAHGISANDAAHSCLGMPIPYSWSQSGTVDSTLMAGTTVALPISGTYRIDVNGTWTNDSHGLVDAEYVEQGASTGVWAQGWPGLGDGFGDLMVNDAFVNWGSVSATHTYSLSGSFTSSVKLNVFDGDSATTTFVPSWYGDNAGSLNYTITYVGP